MNNVKQLPMRNLWRILAFDVAAPLAGIAALVMIGRVRDWPWWWVSACSILVLLIVEGMALNFLLLRRDGVTVGTDDDRPALRFAVVGLCTLALGAALLFEYKDWTVPDRNLIKDSDLVVQAAVEMAETAATVSPSNPEATIDKAATMMVPDRVDAFRQSIGKSAMDLAGRNIAVEAQPLAAGVEAIGPAAARVAVVLRSTQNIANQEVKQTVVPVRVILTKRDGRWLVLEMAPIHVR